jgi:hypothetical protein
MPVRVKVARAFCGELVPLPARKGFSELECDILEWKVSPVRWELTGTSVEYYRRRCGMVGRVALTEKSCGVHSIVAEKPLHLELFHLRLV